MPIFKDVQAGDELWVVNGHQSSAFEANVIEVTEHTIEVEIPEKEGAVYVFDRTDGTALEGPAVSKSFLAFDGDWRVRVILDHKEHNWFHENLVNQAAEFKRAPSPEKAEAINQLVVNWTAYVAKADPDALIATSATEYLILSKLTRDPRKIIVPASIRRTSGE